LLDSLLQENIMSSVTKGKLIQLSVLQEPSYGIPGDVTFHIQDGMVDKENAIPSEVKGHKAILGAFSPVFKSMFFGPMKETRDIIPIEQTTLKAFEIFIDYIYQKDIDWSKMTVLELYDIVNLAERYQMSDLMKEIKTQMEIVAITDESLMDTAHIAAQFSQFPGVSSTLLDTCARFLQKTKRTPQDRLDFATNQSGGGQEAITLHLLILVRDLPPLEECGNCREPKDKCMDGKVVESRDKFTIGLKLRVNTRCGIYWGTNGGGRAGKVYTVLSKPAFDVVSVQQEGAGAETYAYQYSGTETFCYNCC